MYDARVRRPLVLSLAALAGLGGIGSELLWLRVVEHTVGQMPLAAPLVVACFIVAAGVGAVLAPLIRRPALVAVASALLDGGLMLGFDAITGAAADALVALAPTLGLDGAAALVGCAMVIPPALLVGVVLPVVMEAAGEGASAYGAHALGAVVGVVLLEALVLGTIGVRGALAGLAAAHLACAAGMMIVAGRLDRSPWARLPAILMVVGAGSGAVQGGWLVTAPLLERPFAVVAPAVVATMLLGLSVGARAWSRWRWSFDTALALVVGGGAASLVVLSAVVRTRVADSPLWAALELSLVALPSAVPIGALVPAFLGGASSRSAAGAALLAIALGNAVGLTAITHAVTRFAPAPWTVVAGLAVVALALGRRRVAGVLLAVTAAGAAALTGDGVFIARSANVAPAAVEIDALFRGPGTVSAIFRAESLRRLYQTGYQPIDLDARSESLIGAVGAAYAPRHGRALVLGAGSGRSAGAVAAVFEKVDVVDLDPHAEALCRALADDNYRLLERPGVTLHRFDALLAPRWLEPGYDLIVQTVDPGYHAMAAKLYTVEHLTRLRAMLAPGGVLVTWSDATLSARANQVLVNTGRAVFPEQKLFSAFGGLQRGLGVTYYFLVHGTEPLVYQPRMMRFVFGLDSQVRALPLFGGHPPGQIRGVPPASLDLDPPPFDRDRPEWYRLIRGRFHVTSAIHSVDRPEPSIIFGGEHHGELEMLPWP